MRSQRQSTSSTKHQHERAAPNAGSPDVVVDGESKMVVEVKDAPGDCLGRRVMFVGERNTNSKPPVKGLKRIIGNILRFSHTSTHPAITHCSFPIAIVRQNLAFRPIGDHQFTHGGQGRDSAYPIFYLALYEGVKDRWGHREN